MDGGGTTSGDATSGDATSGDATSDGGAPPSGVVLELVAGDIGSRGNVDGTGTTARFAFPAGISVDGAGNVYVADTDNSTVRKVTALGVVTTLAGSAGASGSADGTGAAARFASPAGAAVDAAGNVYVADFNGTIRKISPAGSVSTLAGAANVAGSADGTGAAAQFFAPAGVAVDGVGTVYVADRNNHTIRVITAAGAVTTLAGTAGSSGSADGTGAAARFFSPTGVAVDGVGTVYVADRDNHTIRKVTAAGVVTTLAGTAGSSGSADGTGAAARFHTPVGVAVDSAGNLYVADHDNFAIRKVTAAGVVTTLAADARFYLPAGVAVDGAGHVYVADEFNHTLFEIPTPGVATTLAGAAERSGSADGTGAAARFASPSGVAVDSAGVIYVADAFNYTIRRVTAAGVATTFAGTVMSGSADGPGASARFFIPTGVTVDSAGNLYVADFGNSTIRKITAASVVTTLAGVAGVSGSADGAGAAARFTNPQGVAVDSADNVYVADMNNSIIRRITPAGAVTTLAGGAGLFGFADGTGSDARFFNPNAVAVDGAGNAYVADHDNQVIRKVTSTGVVTTLAGSPGVRGSADGTGAAARFFDPVAVAIDGSGNLYVADTGNSTIRKVTPAGVTTTIAGTAGMTGVLLGASPRLAFPRGLAITGDSIVISDANAILLLRHGAR